MQAIRHVTPVPSARQASWHLGPPIWDQKAMVAIPFLKIVLLHRPLAINNCLHPRLNAPSPKRLGADKVPARAGQEIEQGDAIAVL